MWHSVDAMELKPLFFVGSSRDDLRALPDDVKDVFGYALFLAQVGAIYTRAKPLRGFGGAGVLEVVDNDASGTYRAVYTVQLASAVYVLHVFQKKSRRGISTPRQEIDLVKSRLRQAEAHHAVTFGGRTGR
jgi:phage-related protein